MSSTELEEHPVAIVLIAVYSALLVFTVSLLVWILRKEWRRNGRLKFRPRHAFLVLILLLTCLRIPNFVILLADPHNSTAKESEKTWYFVLLFNLAALLYLTIFTELILFLARMYDSMRPALLDGSTGRLTDRQRRLVQALVLVVAWVSYGAVFVVFFVVGPVVFLRVISYVTCSFYAVAAVFFAVYGSLLWRRILHDLPLRSAEVTRRIRRVLAVAIIMTGAFLLRAVLNALLPSLVVFWSMSDSAQWVLYTVTFVCIEAFPLFLVEVLVVIPVKRDKVNLAVKEAYSNRYNRLPRDQLVDAVN